MVDSSGLKRVLKDRGQMQSWLARRVGVSESYICLILDNQRNPSADIRQRIATVMALPEDMLFVVSDVRDGTETDDCANDEAVA